MRAFLFLLCCVGLTACSSVSVIEEKENAALAPNSAPGELLVRPFEVPVGTRFDVAAPRGEEDARSAVARTIIEGVCSRGPRWVAPTRAFEDPEKTPAKGLLIDGKILRAQQGSRVLRIGIGFGAGRTRLDTAVRVFNLEASANEPWLTFKTTGGSNVEPGLVAGLISPPSIAVPIIATVAGTAVSGVASGNKGVSEDAKRTGRAIAAEIHDRLAAREIVKRKAWPKRIGTLGTPIGQLNVPSID